MQVFSLEEREVPGLGTHFSKQLPVIPWKKQNMLGTGINCERGARYLDKSTGVGCVGLLESGLHDGFLDTFGIHCERVFFCGLRFLCFEAFEFSW